MADKIEENQEKPYNYVYFILSYDIFRNVNISLSKKYSESNTLEVIEKTEITNKIATFSILVYRFKFFPKKILEKFKNPEKFELEVFLEENNKKFSNKIKSIDINHDNYIYNFEIIEISNKPIDKLEMNIMDQFDLYLKMLSKKELNMNNKEKDDIILSTLNYLISKKKDKKNKKNNILDFSFLFKLFLE